MFAVRSLPFFFKHIWQDKAGTDTAKWLCWPKKVTDSDTERNPVCKFIVQSSHHRGPQHGVFSSSPFWFSVFTDSVSLAGTLAVASNKAAYLKKYVIKLYALCNGRRFLRKAQRMLPIGKKCSHCINKNADAQETHKLRIQRLFSGERELYDSDFNLQSHSAITKLPQWKERAKFHSSASLSSSVSFTKCWEWADVGQASGQLLRESWLMQTTRSGEKTGAERGRQSSLNCLWNATLKLLPALWKDCVCRLMMINCVKCLSALTHVSERGVLSCLAYADVPALIPKWSDSSQLWK